MELRMSEKERDRLRVIARLDERRLKQGQAARLLRLSVRQVRRILARYEPLPASRLPLEAPLGGYVWRICVAAPLRPGYTQHGEHIGLPDGSAGRQMRIDTG
jgi:hypothetical protein